MTNTTTTEVLVIPSGGEFEVALLINNTEKVHIAWSMSREGAERIAAGIYR